MEIQQEDGEPNYVEVYDATGNGVLMFAGREEDRARLIVRAVNIHERLVEALRYIADDESGWRFKRDPLEHARSVVDEMRDMARAALAAAEGDV